MDLLCTDSMSILVIVSDYLSSTACTVKLEGRSHEISASVLPRREESGLHVQERARCHYGRDHVVLRGAEEERSPPRRGGTGTHPDSHECESPKREVVRDRWSLCRNEGAARRFFLINARDLNEAIQVASKFPSVRFGTMEVRPVKDFPGSSPATTL